MRAVETLYFDKKFQLSESRYYLVILELSPQGKSCFPLGTVFYYNKIITSFDEIELFVNANLPGNCLRGCSNLSDIPKFGENMTSIGNSALAEIGYHYLGFYSTKLSSFGADNLRNSGTCFGITFPSTIININANGAYWSLRFYRIYADTPPVWTVPSQWRVVPAYIYVPDEVVEEYKTAATWSDYTDRILPMSQWEVDAANNGWVDIKDGAWR